MYIVKIPNRKSPPAVLLRESYREDGKVKNRTLLNLSEWPDERVSQFALLLHGNKLVPAESHLRIIRTLPHGHVAAVSGVMSDLDMSAIIGGTDARRRALVEAMICSRVISPASKLATARSFATPLAETTLSEEFGVADASEDELYAAMDWLLERQPAIEAKLASRHLVDGGLVIVNPVSWTVC